MLDRRIIREGLYEISILMVKLEKMRRIAGIKRGITWKCVKSERPPTHLVTAWRCISILVAEKAQLSEREVEVLNLILRGYSARMVSDELCISYNTARNHIQRIYAKLDVHSCDEPHDYVKTFMNSAER